MKPVPLKTVIITVARISFSTMKQDPIITQGVLDLTLVYEHVSRLFLISKCRNRRAFLDIKF